MAQAPQTPPYISAQEYLELEQAADNKHEYLDGEILAIAGASDAHVKVTGNAFALLKSHLRGSGCSTYIADMKLRIGQDDAFFYPDLMVCCDPADQLPEQDLVKNNPKLLIEVLSPSTEAFDRGKKFMLYRKLPSLEEYLLIDPRAYYVELFRKENDIQWSLTAVEGADSLLNLKSLEFTCALGDLYEDVRFS